MLVVADVLGVPEEDHQRFRQGFGLGRTVGRGRAPAPRAAPGENPLAWLDAEFAEYIEDRRREPREDVLTKLALATYPDGSMPEVINVVRTSTFLFAAGPGDHGPPAGRRAEAPGRAPRRCRTQLRADHKLIPDFLEEVLRVESPVKTDFRLTKKTTNVGGVDIKAGTPVMLLNGAANRDPAASSARTSSASTDRTPRPTWPSGGAPTPAPAVRWPGSRVG